MNSKVYKWCAVPLCKNTSITTPNKVFVYVPNKKIVRDMWLRLARRNPAVIVTNSPIYFCEDHFDLPNDMENYMQYHVMGSVSQVRMKPGCIPTKFVCQPDRNQVYMTKTCRSKANQKEVKMVQKHVTTRSKSEKTSRESPAKEKLYTGKSHIPGHEDLKKSARKLPKRIQPSSADDSRNVSQSPCSDDCGGSPSNPVFRCDSCGSQISGFRYSCVQCPSFDMCSACEGDRRHSHHYMLRIPKPTHNDEIKAVLDAVREKLGISLQSTAAGDDDTISIKSEVKDDDDEDYFAPNTTPVDEDNYPIDVKIDIEENPLVPPDPLDIGIDLDEVKTEDLIDEDLTVSGGDIQSIDTDYTSTTVEKDDSIAKDLFTSEADCITKYQGFINDHDYSMASIFSAELNILKNDPPKQLMLTVLPQIGGTFKFQTKVQEDPSPIPSTSESVVDNSSSITSKSYTDSLLDIDKKDTSNSTMQTATSQDIGKTIRTVVNKTPLKMDQAAKKKKNRRIVKRKLRKTVNIGNVSEVSTSNVNVPTDSETTPFNPEIPKTESEGDFGNFKIFIHTSRKSKETEASVETCN